MKIILLRDVTGVGRKGDLKNVADGHALNFLLPRKFAVEATPQAIKEAERANAQKNVVKEEANKYFETIKAGLESKILNIKKRADEKGSLYAAISAKDVLASLRELKDPELKNIKENMIILPHSIKTTGAHDISIAIGKRSLPAKLMIVADKKKQK